MDNGHSDLNDLFVRTYGPLYVQHSQVFEDLFENLKGYYYGVDVDLVAVMEDFFVVLMQRMFKLLNPQHNYDDQFWECMTAYMDELKPFGDVPAKLTTQVKRAFIAARTFVQGLAIGRDVVIRVSKVGYVLIGRSTEVQERGWPVRSQRSYLLSCAISNGRCFGKASIHTLLKIYPKLSTTE